MMMNKSLHPLPLVVTALAVNLRVQNPKGFNRATIKPKSIFSKLPYKKRTPIKPFGSSIHAKKELEPLLQSAGSEQNAL